MVEFAPATHRFLNLLSNADDRFHFERTGAYGKGRTGQSNFVTIAHVPPGWAVSSALEHGTSAARFGYFTCGLLQFTDSRECKDLLTMICPESLLMLCTTPTMASLGLCVKVATFVSYHD